jgi:hypothetical protein
VNQQTGGNKLAAMNWRTDELAATNWRTGELAGELAGWQMSQQTSRFIVLCIL